MEHGSFGGEWGSAHSYHEMGVQNHSPAWVSPGALCLLCLYKKDGKLCPGLYLCYQLGYAEICLANEPGSD